jgi:hypothetical protein
VQQGTMRVIDGMHRLRAAMLIGRPTMRALLVDCSEAEIIVLAIQENARHGLPLSLPDREAAAFRLLASATNWSDRMIAETAGLSPGTVAQIRARSTTGSGQSNRVGRDGRVRPVDLTKGRKRAVDFLANNPEASVREIAKAANISLSTAHDVRKRISLNQDPIPRRHQDQIPRRRHKVIPCPTGADWGDVRKGLAEDPAIKYKPSGRELVKWLDRHWIEPIEIDQRLDAVPPHASQRIALVAERLAGEWKLIADLLTRRADEFLSRRGTSAHCYSFVKYVRSSELLRTPGQIGRLAKVSRKFTRKAMP